MLPCLPFTNGTARGMHGKQLITIITLNIDGAVWYKIDADCIVRPIDLPPVYKPTGVIIYSKINSLRFKLFQGVSFFILD